MNLNHDIWHEIISHFEYPTDYFALKYLAITSRSTSGFALDVLWRNGTRLLKIVSVINSFADSPNKPFLKLEHIHHYESDPGESSESEDGDEDSLGLATDLTEVAWVSLSRLRSLIKRLTQVTRH